MEGLLLISITLPAVAGILLLVLAFAKHLQAQNNESGMQEKGMDNGEHTGWNEGETIHKMTAQHKRGLRCYVGIVLILSTTFMMSAAWAGESRVTLFTILDVIPVYFHIDGISRLFASVISIVWLAVGIYSFTYMEHEGEEERYFGIFMLLYGVLAGFVFSGNLITMYLFYELITLVSMPLVLHNGTREAVVAALKYLFYSLCGAYGGLFGIFFLYRYCGSLDFAPGGTLEVATVQGHEGILLIAVFIMLVGFGAKAGMLPLHGWLPAAHPVAPSPASAALSAIIVKAGVLAIVRVVFYVVGADFLRDTWVQYAWMILALLTIFMGSLLAFRERGFKKRLAYSTVSQVSYILFGLSLMTPGAMTGALLHVVAHALIKCGLFLTAGVFLYCFGYTRVEQLVGLGKRMPKVMWCYLIFSLALTGIPPTCGFISKWYLAQGALQSKTRVFTWLGPAVLLVSALLTAGYLLPIAMKGFFPGEDFVVSTNQDKNLHFSMLLPLMVLAALVLLLGILPNPLTRYMNEIVLSILGNI